MPPFRIGIIGGMGPLAGVELQRLIIEATPARSDQEHLQVLTFTNPQIPDRTQSLADNQGREFIEAVTSTAKLLEQAGANVVAMPCMTAHSRYRHIQNSLAIPLVDAVTLTCALIQQQYQSQKITLLATNGSLKAGVYTANALGQHFDWKIPNNHQQITIMSVIYDIKAGVLSAVEATKKLDHALKQSIHPKNEVLLLGCTELGMLHDELIALGYGVIDPLRVLANNLVRRAKACEKAIDRPVAMLDSYTRLAK